MIRTNSQERFIDSVHDIPPGVEKDQDMGFDGENRSCMRMPNFGFSGVAAPERHIAIAHNMGRVADGIGRAEAVLEGAFLSRVFKGRTEINQETGVRQAGHCQWIDLSSIKNYFGNVATFSDKCGEKAARGVHFVFDNSITRSISGLIPMAGLVVGATVRTVAQVIGAGLQMASHVFVGALILTAIVVCGILGLTGGALFMLYSAIIAYINKTDFRLTGLEQTVNELLGDDVKETSEKIKARLDAAHEASQAHRMANYWYGDGTLSKLDDDTHAFIVEKLLDREGPLNFKEIRAEYIAAKKVINSIVTQAAMQTASVFPKAKAFVREVAHEVLSEQRNLPKEEDKDAIVEDIVQRLLERSRPTGGDGRGEYEMLTVDDNEGL